MSSVCLVVGGSRSTSNGIAFRPRLRAAATIVPVPLHSSTTSRSRSAGCHCWLESTWRRGCGGCPCHHLIMVPNSRPGLAQSHCYWQRTASTVKELNKTSLELLSIESAWTAALPGLLKHCPH